MFIFIKDITGRTLQIEVDPTDTIQTVKIKIYQQSSSVSLEMLRLIYGGMQLDDVRKRVCDYGIQHDTTIHLVARTLGAGSFYDLISPCPECPKDPRECKIVKYCKDNMPIEDVAENAWSALCDAFHISKEAKEEIEINSYCATIRFADVIHRLCHANPALTWSTIKTYV